jgi:hypothetical protein
MLHGLLGEGLIEVESEYAVIDDQLIEREPRLPPATLAKDLKRYWLVLTAPTSSTPLVAGSSPATGTPLVVGTAAISVGGCGRVALTPSPTRATACVMQ